MKKCRQQIKSDYHDPRLLVKNHRVLDDMTTYYNFSQPIKSVLPRFHQ